MAEVPLFLAQNRGQQTLFVPGFSTRPRVIYTPGADGSLITGINIAGNDAGANKMQFGVGRALTNASAMGTGSLVDGGGSSDTITRTSGSFITDGWRVGDRMLVQGATTLANDFAAILTAVAATTLTFATATVSAAEDLPSAAKLIRLAHLWYVAIAAGSGEPDVVSVSGLNATQAPFLDVAPDRKLELGPDDLLTGALTTALTSGEVIAVACFGGDY